MTCKWCWSDRKTGTADLSCDLVFLTSRQLQDSWLRIPSTSVLVSKAEDTLRIQITSFPPFSTSWRVTNPPKFEGKGYRPHFSVRGWMPGSHWGRACGLKREGRYSWGHLWKILSATAWQGNLRPFHSIICWCSTALFLDKNIPMNYFMLTTKY